MSAERWAAIGGDQSYVMQGDVLAADQDVTGVVVVRVGDGQPDNLPASLLPDGGAVLPGLTQDSPADVISAWVRIWIAGFLARQGPWDGVICALHGDVSHWIHLSAIEVVSSQSFLSPRLIASLNGAQTADTQAITDSLSRPERLAGHLRIAEVSGQPTAITGHLIGAELAAARPYWLGQQVAVIGDGPLITTYEKAIESQGCPVTCHDSADLIPAGLEALGAALGVAP
ncbi:2-dehydro-3-deoxygalactonokinase [Roseovarius sp. 2305UL8-3]|uniref:2-dehydro-3-deoxygalactonokinase n=1 Tax=Roseovarius conchicola TaxID=3121636 RepID=UPI003526D9D2